MARRLPLRQHSTVAAAVISSARLVSLFNGLCSLRTGWPGGCRCCPRRVCSGGPLARAWTEAGEAADGDRASARSLACPGFLLRRDLSSAAQMMSPSAVRYPKSCVTRNVPSS
jgi:hypothetical protein